MKNSRKFVLLPLVLIAAQPALARQTYPFSRRVNATLNPGVSTYIEPTIAVSRQVPSHLLVAFTEESSPSKVHYAVSLDAAATPFAEGLLATSSCPTGGPFDSVAAASPTTDNLWVSAAVFGQPWQAINVWHNGPGTTAIGPASEAICLDRGFASYGVDKPYLAIGPSTASGHPETLSSFFTVGQLTICCTPVGLVGRRTLDLSPTWSSTSIDVRRGAALPAEPNEQGIAFAHAVLGSNPNSAEQHIGRIVAVWRPFFPTGGTPVTLHSDDDGATWLGAPGNDQVPVLLDHSYSSSNQDGDPIYPVDPGDFPSAASVSVNTVPAVSVDPLDPRKVYVIFWGSSDHSGSVARRNIDLYIAQSTDFGATFSPVTTLHVVDSLLGEDVPVGSTPINQIQPSIVVDQFHGVNIFYYKMVDTGSAVTYQAKYARITNFSADPALLHIDVKALAPAFAQPYRSDGSLAPMKEYEWIAASGCQVYVAYMSCHEGDGFQNIYVSRVTLCPADVVADGTLDSADVAGFGAALSSGSPAADLNHDQAIDGLDVNCFIESMTCGCPGTP